LEYVKAGSLAANPRNWRRHPPEQMAALRSVLAELGWAGALLYNRRTKHLIDGHARLELVDPDQAVPVLVGSWSPAQEAKILLTLDPIAGMASAAGEQLGSLLEEVKLDAPEMAALGAELQQLLMAAEPAKPTDETEPAKPTDETEPAASREDYRVVVECTSRTQQQKLLRRLEKEGYECRGLANG